MPNRSTTRHNFIQGRLNQQRADQERVSQAELRLVDDPYWPTRLPGWLVQHVRVFTKIVDNMLLGLHSMGNFPQRVLRRVTNMGLPCYAKLRTGRGPNILKDRYSDLDLALKMLDNARAIVEKSPDHNVEKVKIFSALGAVYMEREDIDDSLDYCFKALATLDDLVEPDHHQIIKLNCRIYSIFKLAFKAGDAIPYCAKAISLCKSRMLDLKMAKVNICDNASSAEECSAEGGVEKSALEDAMELLIGIFVELEKKLEGLQQELPTPTPAASEAAIASKASEKKPRGASFVYP